MTEAIWITALAATLVAIILPATGIFFANRSAKRVDEARKREASEAAAHPTHYEAGLHRG